MKQPFEFGDMVTEPGFVSEPFPIKRMEFWGDHYRVWTPDGRLTNADDLELYQEPQKKKLYAYRVYGKLAEIRMFKFELAEDVADCNHLERAPEFDIEYPEPK